MSVKSSKDNIYLQCRESLKLSRDKASDQTGLPADKIERIETGKQNPEPYDILMMANGYGKPELCNEYCSNHCDIGKKYVHRINVKELAPMVLEMIATLNATECEKNRLIEIAADGVISADEMEDFVKIQEKLEHVSMAVNALQLWIEKTQEADGFDRKAYDMIKNNRK